MAYKLTDEQRAERLGVTFQAGESFDFGNGHFLENWRRSDKELDHAEIYVLVHGGFKFREVYRHRLPVMVDLDARDLDDGRHFDARRMLTTHQYTCQESIKWQKHLIMRKSIMSPPTCPIERLIDYVKARSDLLDKVLFRFGDGCTDKEGQPVKLVELTGYDIFNRASNWKEDYNFLAKGGNAGVVIPLRGVKGTMEWETAEDDFAPKIMTGTWGLFSKFERCLTQAIKDFGEDVADPRWNSAVYRIIYDVTPRGGKKPQPSDQYSVQFVERYNVPASAEAIGGNVLPLEFTDALKKFLQPSTTQELYETLQAGLVYDLDLAKIMGFNPSVTDESSADDDVFADESQKRQEERASVSAAKPKSRRRVVVDDTPKPQAPVEPEAEPCPKCGTPWPEGVARCPGKDTKGCTAFDQDMVGSETETDSDSDEIPFAD